MMLHTNSTELSSPHTYTRFHIQIQSVSVWTFAFERSAGVDALVAAASVVLQTLVYICNYIQQYETCYGVQRFFIITFLKLCRQFKKQQQMILSSSTINYCQIRLPNY